MSEHENARLHQVIIDQHAAYQRHLFNADAEIERLRAALHAIRTIADADDTPESIQIDSIWDWATTALDGGKA